MIRITYAQEQQGLAECIRDDLASQIGSAQPLLVVLVSEESSADSFVQAEIERALRAGEAILPILVDDAAPPAILDGLRYLDFKGGYERAQLLSQLPPASRPSAATRRANRRALIVVGGIAALMFALAIVSMVAGVVGFPVAEYNEEATFQSQWIDGLIRETLEQAQPRSTEDALNFAATFEAAPTRLYFYIRGTATALARQG